MPGEKELVGSAIHFCAVCDGPFYKDKDVLVVGGGNSGFQEGLFLSRYAKNVTIVEFLPEVKASKLLQNKVAEQADMRVVTNHAIQGFQANRGKLAGVEVLDCATNDVKTWHPDGVFIFAGLSPNSDFVPPSVERRSLGASSSPETIWRPRCRASSRPAMCAGSTKQAAAAAGEGATAALMIREYLHGQ